MIGSADSRTDQALFPSVNRLRKRMARRFDYTCVLLILSVNHGAECIKLWPALGTHPQGPTGRAMPSSIHCPHRHKAPLPHYRPKNRPAPVLGRSVKRRRQRDSMRAPTVLPSSLLCLLRSSWGEIRVPNVAVDTFFLEE